jgi:hypothetical protein
LKLTKSTTTASGALELPPCPTAPGWHEFSGYVRLDKDLSPTMEGPNPRPDCTYVTVNVTGDGIQYDPPAEFCSSAGAFQIAERTPGWLRFTILFKTSETTKQAKVAASISGQGTAWLDDIEIRPIKKP